MPSVVAVLGPGGVGAFLAGALTRAGQSVTLVAREETAELITSDGISVQSVRLGDFHASPGATVRLTETVDVLFVATKATNLKAALKRVQATPELVVPLLNGFEHMALLRERFGEQHVAAGAIRIESDRPAPGRVVQTSPFLRVDLAADDPSVAAHLPAVAAMLEQAGVPARIERSEAQVMWSKLVRLCALALTTSASDEDIGFIRNDPQWRSALEACIAEAAAVAGTQGASINPAVPLGELLDAHPGLRSSMQRDIAGGREPELDAIAGAVLRAGARGGVPCPTIARLAQVVAGRAGIEPPLL